MVCKYLAGLLISFLLFLGCSGKEETPPMFRKLSPDQTNITFTNAVSTNDSVNMLNNVFIYNGGGVATGDINNDGLIDIYFAGNMVSSRLYLNKGNMEFEDIKESAGVTTKNWASGVSMADINGDGFLDIYVSVSGSKQINPEKRRNLLFINNGDATFTEAAAKYNIADTGFTTHAAFLDYDLDRDLDLFLLGNSPEEFSRGETGELPMGGQGITSPEGYDQLYRNNGDGTFTNVSEEAGILKKLGYGLGVAVSDLNGDGWPDIYVSNDFTPNDVVYRNNANGTFTDTAAEWFRHTSFAGMGIDIADYTNNGWPDIMQLDMMPKDLNSRKRMSGTLTYSGFLNLRRRGYFPHYNMNSLQMNHGITNNGRVIFSEVGRMANVSYTNWSWSTLFGDFDNDGFKDLFITNGFPKKGMDSDYLTEKHNANRSERIQILENLPGYEVPNYIFRNNGDLTFADKSDEWGMNEPGFSYGAAYADLNNDGSLDLVVNNINAPASIYQASAPDKKNAHYLKIKLHGTPPNTGGIGAKLFLTSGGKTQYIYHNPYRGAMSTMDNRIHFGLGKTDHIDTLKVLWPDGKINLQTDLQANQMITVKQVEATNNGGDHLKRNSPSQNNIFLSADSGKSLKYKHSQHDFVDYSVQPLLPYMISRQGPPVAAGDVNGDGLDDLFIGGSVGYSGQLFIQEKDGSFDRQTQYQPWEADKTREDWDALFFDANGDGLLDLYVASGGYHSTPASLLLQDRLYINHGGGKFLKDSGALPRMLTSTGTVTAGDFNGDGQMDLFVGGRLTPRNYPRPTRSYLLQNDGGQFTDVTKTVAPELIEPGGMVTDAVWIDMNGDNLIDLVTAGEWMPIQFFENDGKQFNDITDSMDLPPTRGWWYSLEAGDFNNDGYQDLAAGNLGRNHTYTTSEQSKFGVIAGNFSGYGTTEIVLTKVVNGTEYPFYGLTKLGRAIYKLGIKFQSFQSFANAPLHQVFDSPAIHNAIHYQADTFATVWLQNRGDGTFSINDLPNLAQISPVNDILVTDVDEDGNLDIILAGNLYHTEPTAPRADAGSGLWLKGDGQGKFVPIPPTESGFLAPLDARDIELITTAAGRAILVGNNDDSLQVFNIKNSSVSFE